jgi:preprotein translocase subunit YajC
MTNFGLFGKLLSVDDVTNVAEIETSPGTIVRVHRQTLSKVVSPEELAPSTGSGDVPRSVEEAMEIANREQAEREASAKVDAEAPAYGERVDDPITKATTKRAPRAPKKTDV